MREYTSVDAALKRVKASLHQGHGAEAVPALQAYGRVSAKDVLAPSGVPPFPTSQMDGFAVIAADLEKATVSRPAVLRVRGALGPGQAPRLSVSHGETIQVATGARVPSRADAVVPIEAVEVRTGEISVGFAPQRGSYVFRAGGDVRRGERVLYGGRAIRAQEVGLLTALGIAEVSVRTKPTVSVIATGTELTSAASPKAGKVPDSHSPIFVRLCQVLGCLGMELGVVGDDPEKLTEVLRKALATSDLVLTLGGTSAGSHDLVVGVISGLGPEVMIQGISMDRGRVTAIASVGGKPILMMPGPVQGAMNAFILLGIPLIETLTGRAKSELKIHCTLGEAWEARKKFSDFRKIIYVELKNGDESVAKPLVAETESIKVLADADGYVVVPENIERIEKGEPVVVRLLPGFSSFW